MVIDKERAKSTMPKEVKNTKMLLLNAALEYKKTEVTAKINITTPGQVQAFIDEDGTWSSLMANKVIESGATVVFCRRASDDVAQKLYCESRYSCCPQGQEERHGKSCPCYGCDACKQC